MRWTSSALFRVLQRAFHASAYRRVTLDELEGPPLHTRLRPYQESCLVACVDALRAGISRIGVSLPTGAGKTRVFISLLDQISSPPEKPEATRSLVIVNTIELARQAASQVEAMFPSWEVEIEQGGKHKASGEADVTIATYQTLLQPLRLAKFDPRLLKAIVIDEAHHAASPSYRRLLSHFHPEVKHPDGTYPAFAPDHKIPLIGFSATFSRHDGLALGSVFERIVYHRDFLEMIKEKWLCDVRFTSVRANIQLAKVTVNTKTGDFNATSLAHVINSPVINELVLKTWLDRALTRKSTLIFCVNLDHVNELTKTFREAGVDARYVYSGTPVAERKAFIKSFKEGLFPVLINCAILTEGADIPNIDCVVVARPTRSRNLFAQMIGRGMRLSPNTSKEDCRIIDFVDSTARVVGVVSTPTLFGLDPSEIIDDESLESMEQRAAEAIELESEEDGEDDRPRSRLSARTIIDVPEPRSVTYTDYDDPFTLADQCSGAPHINKLSTFGWVGCGEDVYVLECMGKGYIRIEPLIQGQEKHFWGYFIPTINTATARALKISPFRRSRKILTASTLDAAVRGCDTYVRTKVVTGEIVMGLHRSAKWRKAPATPSQKSYLSKILNKTKASIEELLDENSTSRRPRVDVEALTKGQAFNMITRLKHGARGRYEKKVKTEAKTVKQATQERRRRGRETVQVGPLSRDDVIIEDERRLL